MKIALPLKNLIIVLITLGMCFVFTISMFKTKSKIGYVTANHTVDIRYAYFFNFDILHLPIRHKHRNRQKLVEENIRLKYTNDALIRELQLLTEGQKVISRYKEEKLNVIPVQISYIQNPIVFKDSGLLSGGSTDGIGRNMPIVNESGLVGKVAKSTNNSSIMTPIYDRNFTIGVKLSNSGAIGIFYGTGDLKYGTLQLFDTNYTYNPDDRLYAYSLENSYFTEIEIGKPLKNFNDVNQIKVELNSQHIVDTGYVIALQR